MSDAPFTIAADAGGFMFVIIKDTDTFEKMYCDQLARDSEKLLSYNEFKDVERIAKTISDNITAKRRVHGSGYK